MADGRAKDGDLTVTGDPANPQRGTARWRGRDYPCALGRGGIATEKREGDGATPRGRFALRRILSRAGRGAAPDSGLEAMAIGLRDGWCDDPADADYNRPVTLPHRASAEALWRADGLYDLVVILGHNDDPVAPGAGSAIFLHLAGPGWEPTEGCVAMAGGDLRQILEFCTPETCLRVD